MSFFNFIADLLRDPRGFIASAIAMGPLAAYGFVFAVIKHYSGFPPLPVPAG